MPSSVPEIGNRMREVIAEYTAEDVYSTKRSDIQDKLLARAEAMLGEKMMERSESKIFSTCLLCDPALRHAQLDRHPNSRD